MMCHQQHGTDEFVRIFFFFFFFGNGKVTLYPICSIFLIIWPLVPAVAEEAPPVFDFVFSAVHSLVWAGLFAVSPARCLCSLSHDNISVYLAAVT